MDSKSYRAEVIAVHVFVDIKRDVQLSLQAGPGSRNTWPARVRCSRRTEAHCLLAVAAVVRVA